MEEIQFYKINEVLNHKYYQIPQELLVNGKYKDKLNSDSKILYSFLLDRLTLSQLNNWVDEFGRIYLIFTRQEVQEKLNLSEKTASKAFKQLIDVKLIGEKRQGLGKPNLIYVGKIIHEEIKAIPEQENLQLLTRKNYSSGIVEFTGQEQEILPTINTNNINTNIIKTESINLESNEDEIALNDIKEKCNLNEFTKEDRLVLEDVIDGLYYRDNLKVGDSIVKHPKIIEKLKLIVKENLVQLINILHNMKDVQNVKSYLMICLYNNLGNTHITTRKESCSSAKEINREYPEGFFDNFYANFSQTEPVVN